jgi:ribosomal protein S17E
MMTKYVIDVEDELWEKFKQTVTRDRTINKAIVEMITRRVDEVEAGNKRSKRGS